MFSHAAPLSISITSEIVAATKTNCLIFINVKIGKRSGQIERERETDTK